MDLLLDTNIVIDHFGNRPGFVDDANKVFCIGAFGDANLWVAPQSLNDTFYILRKVLGAEAIQKAFAKSLTFLHVCPVSHDLYQRATDEAWPDMEDCLIALCAQEVKADYIVTRDAKGFSKSPIKAISPQEALELMRSKYGLEYDQVET